MRQFVCLHCGHKVTQPRCNGVRGWQVRCDQCGGPVQRCQQGDRMERYRMAGGTAGQETSPEQVKRQSAGETGWPVAPAGEQSAGAIDSRRNRRAFGVRVGRQTGGYYRAGGGRCRAAAGAGRGRGRGGRCW